MRAHLQIVAILLMAAVGCSTQPAIILEGDSLTEGAKKGYASKFVAPAGYRIIDHGTGGQQLAEMLGADYLRRPMPGSVIVLFAGTNDLYYNATPEDVLELSKGFCTRARRQGCRVVVTTLLPRDDFPYSSTLPGTPAEQSAEHEVRRNAFNDLLRASWGDFADALVDLAADPEIGDKGDEFDQRFYDEDEVHFSESGKRKVAAAFEAVVANFVD